MSARKVEVPAEAAGQRLDVFLVGVLGQPRHQVQRLITAGLVELNGAAPKAHAWLKPGDVVVVRERPAPPPTAVVGLTIVAETPDYLVVCKPAGVLTHPAPGSRAASLSTALVAYDPDIAGVGDPDRPGIVHRLDRDVTGLLVVAKTVAMYDALKWQFQERQVKKVYTALVEGQVTKPEGVLDFVLARSRTHRGQMAARPKGQAGRTAETRYTVTQAFHHYTLLELVLVTGRMHQIRAHCKAFGHAIVGDPLYGSKLSGAKLSTATLTRPFLACTTLGFCDLAGAWHEYTVPIDHELQAFLTTIA